MPESEDKREKDRFWQVDPTIYLHRTKDSLSGRVAHLGGVIGRTSLFGLLLLYPVVLLLIGLFFGGLAFWASFLGTVAVMGGLIWKTGYARNFANWNPSHARQLIGLTAGFLATLGFVLGLVELHIWFLPLMVGVLVLGLALAFRREL